MARRGKSAYDATLDALAAVIYTAAPDLLAIQEISDLASFEALRHRLGGTWTGMLSTDFETPSTLRKDPAGRRATTCSHMSHRSPLTRPPGLVEDRAARRAGPRTPASRNANGRTGSWPHLGSPAPGRVPRGQIDFISLP
jgi:hypothetical protein